MWEKVKEVFFIFFIILSGVRLSALGTALFYKAQMIEGGDCTVSFP
jgi:hypothetical protein